MFLIVVAAYPAKRKSLKFEIAMMADGVDDAATERGFRTQGWSDCHLALTSYKASDGPGVSVSSADFDKRDDAARYFELKLRGADEVIEQGDETDRNGERVGRRAVLLTKPDHREVMWTNAGIVRSFSSSELSVVLEFEKQYGPRFSRR